MKVITVTSNRLVANKLIVLFSAIAVLTCFALLQMKSAFAEDASGSAETVKKPNMTFPISTLGNCANLEECKAYCEDPTNKEACTNFAKSKGFYKPPQGAGNARKRLILEKAKAELGCESEDACKALCKEEGSREKCAEFAKKYKFKEEKRPVNQTILEKAKAALGCTEEKSCKALCQKEENREKCSSFAKSAGLPGGMVKIASGSGKNQPNTEQLRQIMEKCKQDPGYCRENMSQIEGQIMKLGDQFCKTNPEKCKEFIKNLQEASRGGSMGPVPRLNKPSTASVSAGFGSKPPERPKSSGEKTQFNERYQINDPKVQGVSTSPSILERIFEFLFK